MFLVLLRYAEWCEKVGGGGEGVGEGVESGCEKFGQGELRVLKMG